MIRFCALIISLFWLSQGGCRSPRPTPIFSDVVAPRFDGVTMAGQAQPTAAAAAEIESEKVETVWHAETDPQPSLVRFADDPSGKIETLPPLAEEVPSATLQLDAVVESVRLYFPLLQSAFAARDVAAGETLSAAGEFDVKFKAGSENQPLGFYENYRHQLGIQQNTFWGGSMFAGYRLGRGEFEPWYLERETNKSGEFKAGVLYPLARNRGIDARRAALWKAQLQQQRVEPAIEAELLQFIRGGSNAYWHWVAAGRFHQVALSLLEIANRRAEGLKKQVQAGEKAEIELKDNQRLIVSRQAAVVDARRKLRQAAVKLSLFLRTEDGAPRIPDDRLRPDDFPKAVPLDEASEAAAVQRALANRPELAELNLAQRQLDVELQQAGNLVLPEVYGGVTASDDVGQVTSSKKDKSPTVLEASLTVSMPLQRRTARGKIRSLQGKRAQLRAKRQFTADKIAADVRAIRAAITAAYQQIGRARESLDLAIQLENAEQRAYELGNSNLLNVNLREQQRADAAKTLIQAQLDYHNARADYRAALGGDRPSRP